MSPKPDLRETITVTLSRWDEKTQQLHEVRHQWEGATLYQLRYPSEYVWREILNLRIEMDEKLAKLRKA